MALGDEWEAQKMLDRYIHDYMKRKNFLTTAAIFAEEANVDAEPTVKDGPEGLLKEWWHVFWGKYASEMPKHPETMEGSSVKGNLGLDNMLLGRSETSLFAATMYQGKHGERPDVEFKTNQQPAGVDYLVHSDPSSSNASNCQLQTHAEDEQWTPGDNYGAHTGGPSPTSSKVNGAPEANRPRAGPSDAGTINSANSVPLKGWSLTGMSRIPSGIEYPVLNSFVLESNQQSQFQTLIPRHFQDISSQTTANKNSKKMLSFQGSTDSFGDQMLRRNGLSATDGLMIMRQMAEQKMTGPAGVSSEQKQKNRQSQQKLPEKRRKRKNSSKKDKASNGSKVEIKKTSDDDIESMFSPDNGNGDTVSTFFSNLETHATSCRLTKQKGFFFEEVVSLNASQGKVLCCHFSSDGELLASAGDDKKVLLWDLSRYDWVESAEGHSDIITDIRFKPSSHVFATSSLDRTVQIWHPKSPTKPLGKLLGHSGQVNSIDFHPDGDLLCSCDSNDVMKLWSMDQFACKHTYKGATGQVRFQPQFGNLLAAASGNKINLFDFETNTLKHSFEGHANEVKTICWDTSGKYMASVSEESARVWSILYGGKCIQELQSNGNKFESCIFHPAYSNVLVIGSNQSLQLWNSTEKNKTLSTVPAHNGVVAVLAVCTATKMIASASHEGIKLWK